MGAEMMLGPVVMFRFPVEISVLNIESQGEAHVGFSRELFAASFSGTRPLELKDGGVASFKH